MFKCQEALGKTTYRGESPGNTSAKKYYERN